MQKGGRGSSLTKYNGKVQIGGTHTFGIKNLPCLCPSSVQVCKPRPTLLTTLPVLPATYSLLTLFSPTQRIRAVLKMYEKCTACIHHNNLHQQGVVNSHVDTGGVFFVLFFFWSWTFCFFSTPSWRYYQDVTVLYQKCPTVYGSFPI